MTRIILLLTAGLALCGMAGCGLSSGGDGGGKAPAPPALSAGALSDADYAGTQSPGDWWTWTLTSSSGPSTLAGVDATTGVDLGALDVTDPANGYYVLSNNSYSAFALVQSNFLWVFPISGADTDPPLALNPSFAAAPDPCVTSASATYQVANFTDNVNVKNQFDSLPEMNWTVTNGSASVTSDTVNDITISMTGLACSDGVWTGSDGLTLIASGALLLGDLGTNTETGFPEGTSGFIAVMPPSQPVSLDTLNQSHFLMADATPVTGTTAHFGSGRFLKAGLLAGPNTQDDLLHVYTYGGCQANSAEKTYPDSGQTPSEVGNYEWSVDPDGGDVSLQYNIDISCGFRATYKMIMGQLGNGKWIGLPQYNRKKGYTGAPILIQE